MRQQLKFHYFPIFVEFAEQSTAINNEFQTQIADLSEHGQEAATTLETHINGLIHRITNMRAQIVPYLTHMKISGKGTRPEQLENYGSVDYIQSMGQRNKGENQVVETVRSLLQGRVNMLHATNVKLRRARSAREMLKTVSGVRAVKGSSVYLWMEW